MGFFSILNPPITCNGFQFEISNLPTTYKLLTVGGFASWWGNFVIPTIDWMGKIIESGFSLLEPF